MDDDAISEVFLRNISDDDCGVIAFQAITGISRKRSMDLLRNAYAAGVGTFRKKLLAALRKQGYKTKEKEVMPGEHTLALFATTYDNGTYMLWVEGHVAVLRDGDLLNPSYDTDVLLGIDEVTR